MSQELWACSQKEGHCCKRGMQFGEGNTSVAREERAMSGGWYSHQQTTIEAVGELRRRRLVMRLAS